MKNAWTNLDLAIKYERKSLLWITFYMDIIVLLIGWIIWYNYDNIPNWIISTWLRILFLPILLIIVSIIIVTLNWLIYIFCKIIWFNYNQTKIAKGIEKIFWSIFPKYLYSRRSSIWSQNNRTIYYWVIMNIVIAFFIIIRYIFINYPDIRENIYENQGSLEIITKLWKPRNIKLFNLE